MRSSLSCKLTTKRSALSTAMLLAPAAGTCSWPVSSTSDVSLENSQDVMGSENAPVSALRDTNLQQRTCVLRAGEHG
jgi:hypothetical protein